MKQKLFSFLIILQIFISYGISSSLGVKDFQNSVSSGKSATQICAKADFFKGIFSVRSYNGSICKTPLAAAFAEAVCPTSATDYIESQCHKNATSVLQSKNATDVLKQEINKLSLNDKNVFCQKADSVSPILASLCSQQNTNSKRSDNNKQNNDQRKYLNIEIKEALGFFDLREDTTVDQIKKKYRTLALKYHPDKAMSGNKEATEENFKKLNKYYLILQKYKPGSY